MTPNDGFPGSHIFVSDGKITFDYHGYTVLERLLRHHEKVWASLYDGWTSQAVNVDFPLLDTAALNARKMLGPDQYYGDALERARRYIDDIDHDRLQNKA